jgi:hypothetical protein
MTALRTAVPATPVVAGTAVRVLRRVVAASAAALAVALVWMPLHPPVVCLLRAATGIPCPFCGGTTAMAELGRGRPLAALSASPLATLGAPLWVLWPALEGHARRWSARAGRRRVLWLAGSVLVAAWAWQVRRLLL